MKTKNNFLLFCTLILLALSEIMNAQSNFKKGFILTNTNDTVYGLIDFRTDAMNAEQCKFKIGEGKADTIYYPGDIAGYRFSEEGKYYVSRVVTIGDESYKLFLEYLVEGMMNLYYCEIDDQDYYFFERDGKMMKITKRPDVIKDGYFVSDNKYQEFLNYYFKDYPTVLSTTEKVDFNQKSFINVAKRYHAATCTTGESCIVFENKHPDKDYTLFKFSVYGGLEFGTYTYSSELVLDNGIPWGYDKYYKINTQSPVIGGKINVNNPRWSKSFGLQASISLSLFNEKIIIGRGNLGFEYKFPLGKFRPMIGGGFQCAFKVAGNNGVYYNSFSEILPGYFFNLGVEYALGSHAVFIQSSKENCKTLRSVQQKFDAFHIIVGYTF